VALVLKKYPVFLLAEKRGIFLETDAIQISRRPPALWREEGRGERMRE
jgi:hypothetical protein